MKGLETMDLQADINWIQSEISKVRDPQLIMAFKNLLNYRNSKEVSEEEGLDLEVQKQMIATAKKSEEDIKAGRVFSVEEAESMLEQRLGY